MLVNSVKEHQLFPTSGFPTVLTAPLASFAMSLYVLLMSLPRGPSLVGSVVDYMLGFALLGFAGRR